MLALIVVGSGFVGFLATVALFAWFYRQAKREGYRVSAPSDMREHELARLRAADDVLAVALGKSPAHGFRPVAGSCLQ